MNVGGTKTIQLSGTLSLGQTVPSFTVAPKGNRVAFLADMSTDGVLDAFVVTTNGKTLAPVNPTPFLFGAVELQGRSDGARLVFFLTANANYELSSAPGMGGARVKLSGEAEAGAAGVFGFSTK